MRVFILDAKDSSRAALEISTDNAQINLKNLRHT